MEMLEICLKHANYFVYAGEFYCQNKRMLMGSSLVPILVKRVIEDTVDRALSKLNYEPDFWKTYVDDHLTSIKREMVDTLKDKLNSYDLDVKFMVEIQHKNSIKFLYVTVHNCGTHMSCMNPVSRAQKSLPLRIYGT